MHRGFWSLGQGGPATTLGKDEIALTETVANELGVKIGDTILLRIPVVRAIPADSALGKKIDTASGHRLTRGRGLAAGWAGAVRLAPSQQLPRNVFVPLATLQDLLKKPGRANAILVAGKNVETVPDEANDGTLQTALQPQMEDYGLHVNRVTTPEEYEAISSDQLVLSDATVVAAETAFAGGGVQPIVTYLANTLVIGEGDAARKIPYSTIAGVDSQAEDWTVVG